jgi:hypothetical protein
LAPRSQQPGPGHYESPGKRPAARIAGGNFGLTGTFKLSADPFFVEKVVDVAGLYHHPPQKAVVLCVDEKSGIQAYPGTIPGVRDGR